MCILWEGKSEFYCNKAGSYVILLEKQQKVIADVWHMFECENVWEMKANLLKRENSAVTRAS